MQLVPQLKTRVLLVVADEVVLRPSDLLQKHQLLSGQIESDATCLGHSLQSHFKRAFIVLPRLPSAPQLPRAALLPT